MTSEDRRGLPGIVGNPGGQLGEPRETLLGAQVAHGLNDELVTGQVDHLIQQMHLHR